MYGTRGGAQWSIFAAKGVQSICSRLNGFYSRRACLLVKRLFLLPDLCAFPLKSLLNMADAVQNLFTERAVQREDVFDADCVEVLSDSCMLEGGKNGMDPFFLTWSFPQRADRKKDLL